MTLTIRITRVRATVAAVTLAVIALLAACSYAPTGQQVENKDQQDITTQLVQNQPIPKIDYSQMRQNVIEIEKAQAQGVQTTSFFMQKGSPDPIRVCPSIGVPIPNTASLSNPTQISVGTFGSGNYGYGVIDQMDPNGVYAPTSSSGTYVVCVDGNGNPSVAYWEGDVETEFGPAVWDRTTHSIQRTGPSSFHFSTRKGN